MVEHRTSQDIETGAAEPIQLQESTPDIIPGTQHPASVQMTYSPNVKTQKPPVLTKQDQASGMTPPHQSTHTSFP